MDTLIQKFHGQGPTVLEVIVGQDKRQPGIIRVIMGGIKVYSLKSSQGINFRNTTITVEIMGIWQDTIGIAMELIYCSNKETLSRAIISLWDCFWNHSNKVTCRDCSTQGHSCIVLLCYHYHHMLIIFQKPVSYCESQYILNFSCKYIVQLWQEC